MNWQDGLVFAAAAAAVVWLIRHRMAERKSCSGCALAQAAGGEHKTAAKPKVKAPSG